MFEDFTFDQAAVDSGAPPDPGDPNISPRELPSEWIQTTHDSLPSPPHDRSPNSSNLPARHGSATIERLVQQMSEQTLVPPPAGSATAPPRGRRRDQQRTRRAEREAESARTGSEQSAACVSHIPISRSGSSEHSRDPPPPRFSQDVQRPHVETTHISTRYPSTDLLVSQGIQLQPQVEPRPRAPPTTRAVRENLMELMITHGVQCNVQSSTPPSPTSASRASFAKLSPPPQPGDSLDAHMMDAESSLEIDTDSFGMEEEMVLRTLVSLRQASAPGGIRRSSGLYRTSSESALRTGNLVRKKIRMRKRERERPKSPLSPPPEHFVNMV